jgi:nucleotide-binding universal stress UspA family protein
MGSEDLPGTTVSTIVIGIDGSPGAERALCWAAARGRQLGANLVAVHVLTYDHELAQDVSLATIANWRGALKAEVNGPWTARARELGAKVRSRLVEHDSVAGGLLEAAQAEHADLIVLGTHGHGSFTDRLLRSTTYKVAHRAGAPVVIVPSSWQPSAAA